jgi:PAS domain S-box-containing protein
VTDLYEVLALLNLVVFVGLALAAFVQWRRRRDEAAEWLAATFGVLAVVAVTGRFLPEQSDSAVVAAIRRLDIALVVLFPYFLYRFKTSFVKPPAWRWVTAHVLTGAAVIGAFVLDLPEEGEPRSTLIQAYLYLVIVQWVFLSAWVGVRLWRDAAGRTATTRHRMRTLSLGALGMALAIVLAGAASATDEVTGVQVASQVLALVSGPLFLLGFAPPELVRALWRRPAEATFRQAQLKLMEATTREDVAAVVLPHAARLAGGGAVVLVDDDRTIGALGVTEDQPEELTHDSPTGRDSRGGELLRVPMTSGWLVVEASPYAPFFGREETEMLRSLTTITDLALARTKLLQSEREHREQLQEAQRIAHIGSWRWDIADDRVTWSEELYEIYGLNPSEFATTADAFLELVHPEDRDFVQETTNKAFETKEPFSLEHRIVRADGAIVNVHARGRVIVDDDGNPITMIGTAQDITERVRQERFREQFIANAAHELRTPLTTVVGFIDVLERHQGRLSDNQTSEIFAALSGAGSRLSNLVTNLLDLTRLQHGESRMETRPVQLASLSREVLEAIPPPNGTNVAVEMPHDLVVRGDPQRLHQVLSNLLTNAYRYGGPRVVMDAYETDGTVLLSISDDGRGVDESLIPYLFEPFTGGPTSTSAEGSGLGLSIVKTLVEAHGGHIWYEPQKPRGAKFCVRLPRHAPIDVNT